MEQTRNASCLPMYVDDILEKAEEHGAFATGGFYEKKEKWKRLKKKMINR